RSHAGARPVRQGGSGRGGAADDHDMLAPARKHIYRQCDERASTELGKRLVRAEAGGKPARQHRAEYHERLPLAEYVENAEFMANTLQTCLRVTIAQQAN